MSKLGIVGLNEGRVPMLGLFDQGDNMFKTSVSRISRPSTRQRSVPSQDVTSTPNPSEAPLLTAAENISWGKSRNILTC